MKLNDLITKLQQLAAQQGNPNVMLKDAAGPVDLTSAVLRTITEVDAENVGDCEDRVGERVVVLG